MMKLALGILMSLVFLSGCLPVFAQSINSGTITGTVTDQSGAVVRSAKVVLRNAITGYEQSATSDETGSFRFNNVPQNPYRLTATAPGFTAPTHDIDLRSSIPLTINLPFKLPPANP